jgi:hypothetical protein
MSISALTTAMVCSVMVWILWMPTLEESRGLARSAQAYVLARNIEVGTLDPTTLDPWGTPFQVSRAGSTLVVTSWGSNRATRADGWDADDVSTAMADPPHRRMQRARRRQFLEVIGLSAIPWLILCGRTWFRARTTPKSAQSPLHRSSCDVTTSAL